MNLASCKQQFRCWDSGDAFIRLLAPHFGTYKGFSVDKQRRFLIALKGALLVVNFALRSGSYFVDDRHLPLIILLLGVLSQQKNHLLVHPIVFCTNLLWPTMLYVLHLQRFYLAEKLKYAPFLIV